MDQLGYVLVMQKRMADEGAPVQGMQRMSPSLGNSWKLLTRDNKREDWGAPGPRFLFARALLVSFSFPTFFPSFVPSLLLISVLVIGERHSSGGAVVGPRLGYIIIIIDHLRMQPEGYGAAIYIFELLGSYRIFVSPVSFPAGLRGPPLLSLGFCP